MGLTQSTPQQEPEIEEAHKHEHDEGECAGCEKEEECKSEPYNPNLVGTVGYFTKAVVVCTGTMEWPSKLEKSSGNFVHTLFSAIKSRDDVKDRPKITACAEKNSGEGYDIYVYPDQVKYLGVKEEDIPVFIEDVLVKGEISTRLRHVSVSGKEEKPRANQYWRGRMGIDEDQQAKEAGLNEPKKKKDKGDRKREGEKGEKKEKGGEKNQQKEEKKEQSTESS